MDIEKSASRTTDPVALADTHNPTLLNPACTVCHTLLDPVAGAFQNYGDEGYYKDQWGGMDSLDGFYKNNPGPTLNVTAESWRDRQTLAWPLALSTSRATLKLTYANHFWDDVAEEGGEVFLDRLDVLNAAGQLIRRVEFEDLGPPVADWGFCGDTPRNPDTGRADYVRLWGGYNECAFHIDVEIPAVGAYTAEIVAWSIGHDERYEGGGYAELAVGVNGYEEGDVWYRDMRTPGFAGEEAPDTDNSVQWLAREDRGGRAFRRGDGEVLVAGDHGE